MERKNMKLPIMPRSYDVVWRRVNDLEWELGKNGLSQLAYAAKRVELEQLQLDLDRWPREDSSVDPRAEEKEGA